MSYVACVDRCSISVIVYLLVVGKKTELLFIVESADFL